MSHQSTGDSLNQVPKIRRRNSEPSTLRFAIRGDSEHCDSDVDMFVLREKICDYNAALKKHVQKMRDLGRYINTDMDVLSRDCARTSDRLTRIMQTGDMDRIEKVVKHLDTFSTRAQKRGQDYWDFDAAYDMFTDSLFSDRILPIPRESRAGVVEELKRFHISIPSAQKSENSTDTSSDIKPNSTDVAEQEQSEESELGAFTIV